MTETTPQDEALDTAGGEWGDLAYQAWVIIANAHEGDWNAAHPDWRESAERWRDKFHAMLERGGLEGVVLADGTIAAREAAGRSQENAAEPLSAAQPPGEYAQVAIMGHDKRTGWVTDGVLAGSACLDVRDDAGRLIAKIPPHSVYLYQPVLPPGALRAALTAGRCICGPAGIDGEDIDGRPDCPLHGETAGTGCACDDQDPF